MANALSQSEFTRRFIEKKGLIGWLIGAGASVSANMPTASNIVWDLKKRYYCSEESQDFQGNDVQIAPVREKIQAYLESQGFPAQGSNEEYSFYFKLLFGEDYGRQRDYLLEALNSQKISVSAGQRVLAGLIASGYAPCTFTTNFDEVIESSFAKVTGGNITPFHIEGSYAALDALNGNHFPMYVKLHGDFRYKSLKNLESDLENANDQLGKCFVQAGNRFGLVIVGYSGRDQSVMEILNRVLDNENPFPHGVFWICKKNSKLNPSVISFIEKAKSKNVEAHVVEIDDYVALMSSIWNMIPLKSKSLNCAVYEPKFREVNIPLPLPGTKSQLIRFNCLPIQALPDKAYKVFTAKPVSGEEIKTIRHANRGIVVFVDEGIFAWGKREDIEIAFGNDCKLSEENISEKIARLHEHMALKGALEEALCKAISRKAGLIIKTKYHDKYLTVASPSDGNRYVALKSAMGGVSGELPGIRVTLTDSESGVLKESPLNWSEAVQVNIASMNEGYVAVFRPDIWIAPLIGRRLAKDFILKRIGTRKNDVMDKVLSAWINTIKGDSNSESLDIAAFPDASGSGKAFFQLIAKTSYSRRI